MNTESFKSCCGINVVSMGFGHITGKSVYDNSQ